MATVSFSHPVDTTQFEQYVSLMPAKDAEFLGLTPDSKHFTVVYDKLKLFAYIHSAALEMPRDDTYITVSVGKGVRAARGGNETGEELESVVTIPGRTSLRFNGAQMTLVDNARYEPEQVLLIDQFVARRGAGVHRQGCRRICLPVRHPDQPKEDKNPYDWSDDKRDRERHPG